MKTVTASQGMKLMLVPLSLAVVLLSGALPTATAVMIADFEAPTYTAGTNFAGVASWEQMGGDAGSGLVTPDPLNSGYTFVISGSQSAAAGSANYRKSFSSAGVTAMDIATGEVNWLQASPDALGLGSNQGLYLISNVGGSTPAGIFARNTGGVTNIWLSGSTEVDTGISYVSGGGGAPTLNQVYQFSMAFDFTAHTMTGYYQNITGGGSKTLLGSIAIDSLLTASTFAADYGVLLYRSSGVVGFDNIQVTAVPEPSSVALIGLGFTALLIRLRRTRKQG